MATAAHRLPPGSTKFLLGRWFGNAALGEWEPDTREWLSASVVHAEVHAQMQAATELAYNLRLTDAAPVKAFLDGLGARCIQNVRSNVHAQSIQRAIDTRVSLMWDETSSDPFQAVFEAAAQAARAFYASCGFVVAGSLRLEIDLGERAAVHERPAPQVEGYTFAEPAGAKIKIKLATGCFGVSEVGALPAILFHELIVHANASAEAIESRGPWAEAWMDVAGASVLRETMTQGKFGGAEPFAAAGAPDVLDIAGSLLHQGRYLPRPRARGVYPLRRARKDAQTALAVLEREFNARAPDAFWAFCAAINRGSLAPEVRDAAADEIARRLRASDPVVTDAFASCSAGLLDRAMTEGDRLSSAATFFNCYGMP